MNSTMKKAAITLLLMTGVLLVPALLLAHHSHQVVANYEALFAVTGVVTQHDFVNPHSLIHVTAKDENGNTEEWAGYGGTPAMEARLGYSTHMFKIGEERITMYGFPNKDGRKFMIYTKMVRANGQEIPVYQTLQADMDAFMKLHNARTFKQLPESTKHYIGGAPYQSISDK